VIYRVFRLGRESLLSISNWNIHLVKMHGRRRYNAVAAAVAVVACCFLLVASLSCSIVAAQFNPVSREPLQNHHSLSVPFDQSQVYWMFGGSTVLTQRAIRLTPTSQDVSGWLWNDYPIESPNFEIEFRVLATSKQHYGGEGVAMWLLHKNEDPHMSGNAPNLQGPLFGLKENFRGIGIVFDVYDNDNGRNNPSVFVLENMDGAQKRWGYQQDFEQDMYRGTGTVDPNSPESMAAREAVSVNGAPPGGVGQPVGGGGAISNVNYRCRANIRNVGQPVRVLVKVLHNILHVYTSDLPGQASFQPCLTVDFPASATFEQSHLAFTASTGQAADQHQVSEIQVRYLPVTASDPVDVYGKSGGGGGRNRAMGGGVTGWFFLFVMVATHVSLLACALITVTAMHKLSTLTAANIDPMLICAQLNPLCRMDALVYVGHVALLLVGMQWSFALCHVLLLARRLQQLVVSQQASSLYFNPATLTNMLRKMGSGGIAGLLSSYTFRMQCALGFYLLLEVLYLYTGI
jgi:hypothetical protein